MGHTNSTANLSLPQFIGTDKPTWLGDVNGAFSAIDSKIGMIDADISAVDAKADNAVADASNAVTTATNANNTAGTASTTATNALNVANNALTVANNADGHTNQLEAKVGLLADLTTTDKTSIVNAINEVNAKTMTVSVSAEDVAYNNTVSGLTATNVQAAIDELAQGGGSVTPISLTASSTDTFGAVCTAIFNAIDLTKITPHSVIKWNEPTVSYVYHLGYLTATEVRYVRSGLSASAQVVDSLNIKAAGEASEFTSPNTITALTNTAIGVNVAHTIALGNTPDITEDSKNQNISCLRKLLPIKLKHLAAIRLSSPVSSHDTVRIEAPSRSRIVSDE